jgi:CBS domain-containing protein
MATIDRHVTRELVALDARTPCKEAARIMGEKRIGSVGVSDGAGVIGLVTERDLATRVLARDPHGEMPIREAMRTDVPTIRPNATETECANLMRVHYTRHLLVEEQGKVVGIISMRDVIQLMLDEKQFVIEQLSDYISGR